MMPLRSGSGVAEKPDYELELLEFGQPEKRMSFPLWAAAVVAGVFLYRILMMVKVPLTGDEAYYWLWARHLSLGYHDQPPLIGWLIWLTTRFSSGIFWVRLPALLCSAGSAIFFYAFARDFLQDDRKARFALLLFLLLPIFSIAQAALIPDAPLIFSWAFCLWAGWKSLKDGRYWPLVGVGLGLAILSKLMGFFLIVSLFFFFVMNRKARFWLTQRNFWLGAAACASLSMPFWIWNFRHGFENFAFQAQDHIGSTAPSFSSFISYIGLQSVSVSPFLFLLFIPALWMLVRQSWRGDARSQYLLAFFLPIQLFFALTAFRVPAGEEIHWAVAGYLTLLVACVELEGWGKLKSFGLLNCAVFSTMFLFTFAFPVLTARMIQPLARNFPSAGISPFLSGKDYGELLGYRELSGVVGKRMAAVEDVDPSFVLTDSYQLSSEVAYYGKTPATTLLLNGQGGEYARWQDFMLYRGENALWVSLVPFTADAREEAVLRSAFARLGEIREIKIRNGPVVRTFYEAVLYNLRDPHALLTYLPRIL